MNIVVLLCSALALCCARVLGDNDRHRQGPLENKPRFPPTNSHGQGRIPKSCNEYFAYTGMTSSSGPILVTIDPDGAGPIPSLAVFCTRSGGSICATVQANSNIPTTLASSCTVNAAPSELSSFTPLTRVRLCSAVFSPVTYSNTAAEISGLINSTPGGCYQAVSWNCNAGSSAIIAPEHALFVAIKHNGLPLARVYNNYDPEIAQSSANLFATSGLSSNGECDCRSTGCSRCQCARPLSAGQIQADTITIPLTAIKQQYVQGVIMGRGDGTAGTTATTASQTLTVGEIRCCA